MAQICIVTQYYRVQHDDLIYSAQRQKETDFCLVKNVENPHISEIHLLVEEMYDLPIESSKIIQVCINKRLSYNDVFDYYNKNLSNRICVLLNADIYTNDSIELLQHVKFDNTFFSLNRYEDNDDATASLLNGTQVNDSKKKNCPFLKPFQSSIWSQDAWAWKAEKIEFTEITDFHLGIVGCDNYISYLLDKSYTVCNPSNLICVNHYDRLTIATCQYGTSKGNFSKKTTKRLGTMNQYMFLENLQDIPDKYTKSICKTITNAKQYTTSYAFNKPIECIDITKMSNIIASSFLDETATPEKSMFDIEGSWKPDTSDNNPSIDFEFENHKDIRYFDITGKPVNKDDKVAGYVKTFKISYYQGKWYEIDKVFDCISTKNGNFIKRIYLETGIYCSKIRFHSFTFYNQFFFKVKMYNYISDNVLIDNCWQEPVITEKCIYQNIMKFLDNEPNNNKKIPCYFAFPWASYIDNKWTKKYNQLQTVLDIHKKTCKPDVQYFTVCQHMRFREHIELFKQLNIKYVFTPHKQQPDDLLETEHNIVFIPISLYPAQYNTDEVLAIDDRKHFASFVGQVKHKYNISEIRSAMYDEFSSKPECFVRSKDKWHYQDTVFANSKVETNDEFYKETLLQSKFSLCPSGTGPNSIRLWESLSYGSIPIILADAMVLPKIKNIEWESFAIVWKESEIHLLYDHLVSLHGNKDKINEMSRKCVEMYKLYFSQDTMHICVLEYFDIL